MKIVNSFVPLAQITTLANCVSPEGKALCKAVVDVDRRVMVIGAPMHVDEEEALLDDGSEQEYLWGINLYPDAFGTDSFVEFDSMINLRPNLGNRSRSVENPELRAEILEIVSEFVHA